jgi:predicted nucleic acid-binding protein
VIVLDSSFLYALIDGADARHREAADWYRRNDEEALTTPLVIAEVDHLAVRLGEDATRAFHADLLAGAYEVVWRAEMLATSIEVAAGYSDLDLGLTDASLVALADLHSTVRLASFDERHFRTVRPLSGRPAFTLLPIDA